jgi:hypothetical protein
MPTADDTLPRLRLGPIEYALLLVPWGWVLVWTRLWNQYHDLTGDDVHGEAEGEEPRAGYGRAPTDWLDHALLLVPYGWPLAALRHSDTLLGDALGIRGATRGPRGPLLPGWVESSLALGRGALAILGLMPQHEPARPRRRRASSRPGRATGRVARDRAEPATRTDGAPSVAPER